MTRETTGPWRLFPVRTLDTWATEEQAAPIIAPREDLITHLSCFLPVDLRKEECVRAGRLEARMLCVSRGTLLSNNVKPSNSSFTTPFLARFDYERATTNGQASPTFTPLRRHWLFREETLLKIWSSRLMVVQYQMPTRCGCHRYIDFFVYIACFRHSQITAPPRV
jgi:hypothetical protein